MAVMSIVNTGSKRRLLRIDDLMVAVDHMWSIFSQKNMPCFLISNSLRAKLKLLRIQRVDFLCFFNILSAEYNLIAVISLDIKFRKRQTLHGQTGWEKITILQR